MTGRLEPGDLVEIGTSQGLAYVQVTHLHPSYPEVIRALPDLYQTRPTDLQTIADQPTRFVAMIPLSAALTAGSPVGTRLGIFPPPKDARAFPLFRIPITDRMGAVVYCWFWDGNTLTLTKPPGMDIEALPLREVMEPAQLRSKLEA